MRKSIALFVFVVFQVCSGNLYSQNIAAAAPSYPYVKGYLSFIIPWVTISKTFGFSYQITPSIAASKPTKGKGTSKTSNLLFDLGPVFRFTHGWNFIGRVAFETQGRYGFTPVLNKVSARTKAVDYWFSVSTPVRFGNSLPASIGGNLQIGFTFN